VLYRLGQDNRTLPTALASLQTAPGNHGRRGTEGVRNQVIQTPFTSSVVRLGPQLSRGFSTGMVVPYDPPFQPGASLLGLVSPRIAQYHLTLERELPGRAGIRMSYLGAHSDKLLVTRHINTMKASTTPFDPSDPADRQRLPFPSLPTSVEVAENTGTGHFNALRSRCRVRPGPGRHRLPSEP
jgi:hypothetical protein